MQGTVADFDPTTRSGSLLLDDGRRLEFGASAFDASGLRLLRLGQRVQIELAGADPGQAGADPDQPESTPGEVIRVTLPTMSGS
ncbi:cold-shock protein [Natronosporangium hydrolyticum]|uniref:cold-shock protein n=1 Tax=Natronosporangium hydrolyticum TaxID=2811111 RepID=UPI003B84B588